MIAPLPLRTRLIGGEGLPTYRTQLATNNLTTVAYVERYVEEQGRERLSKSPSHPQVFQTWRELGNLHPSAFTEPQTVVGNWVIDRELCLSCTGGHIARGRVPGVGWVCVRHRRWLGNPQLDLRAFPEALAAERHW